MIFQSMNVELQIQGQAILTILYHSPFNTLLYSLQIQFVSLLENVNLQIDVPGIKKAQSQDVLIEQTFTCIDQKCIFLVSGTRIHIFIEKIPFMTKGCFSFPKIYVQSLLLQGFYYIYLFYEQLVFTDIKFGYYFYYFTNFGIIVC